MGNYYYLDSCLAGKNAQLLLLRNDKMQLDAM